MVSIDTVTVQIKGYQVKWAIPIQYCSCGFSCASSLRCDLISLSWHCIYIYTGIYIFYYKTTAIRDRAGARSWSIKNPAVRVRVGRAML